MNGRLDYNQRRIKSMGRTGVMLDRELIINKNTPLDKRCNRLTIETLVKVFVFTSVILIGYFLVQMYIKKIIRIKIIFNYFIFPLSIGVSAGVKMDFKFSLQ